MNWLDTVIIVLIAVPAFIGLRIGIIKAVLNLAGAVVGIVLAGRYYGALSEQLGFIPQASLAKIAAFLIILVAVMLVTSVVARVAKWLTSVVMLGWVNHLGGAVLGLLLGAILCGALLAVWAKFIGVGGPLSGSVLAPVLLDRFPLLLALLPEEFGTIGSFFQK